MVFFKQPAGATPIDDISGLKIQKIYTLSELNEVEAVNISEAVEKYLISSVPHPRHWFRSHDLVTIHKEMFGDVWDWAGKFRRSITNIGIKPYLISTELKTLCDDVRYWLNNTCDLSPVEQAAIVHYRLAWIHPFPNGNGRFSRLVSDRYLKGLGRAHPVWPLDLQKTGPIRKKYIVALKEADIGNFQPLVDFITSCGASNAPRTSSHLP